jgi:hypothetical protein
MHVSDGRRPRNQDRHKGAFPLVPSQARLRSSPALTNKPPNLRLISNPISRAQTIHIQCTSATNFICTASSSTTHAHTLLFPLSIRPKLA